MQLKFINKAYVAYFVSGFLITICLLAIFHFIKIHFNFTDEKISMVKFNDESLAYLSYKKEEIVKKMSKGGKTPAGFLSDDENKLFKSVYISENQDIIAIKQINFTNYIIWLHPQIIDKTIKWECFSGNEVDIQGIC